MEIAPRHIAWREVIELDSRMSAADRKAITEALDILERSHIGQTQFAAALEAQSRAPASSDSWQAIPVEDFSVMPFMADINARREDPRKTFLVATDAANSPETLIFRTQLAGGALAPGNDVMIFNIAALQEAGTPKINMNGEPELMTSPLAITLTHEFQHARDAKVMAWNANKEQKTSLACAEERAIGAENALAKEMLPGTPLRFAYIGAELQLNADIAYSLQAGGKHGLGALMDKGAHVTLETLPEESARKLYTLKYITLNNVRKDAGCQELGDAEANARAMAMLARAGINPRLLNLGTAAGNHTGDAPVTPSVPNELSTQSQTQNR